MIQSPTSLVALSINPAMSRDLGGRSKADMRHRSMPEVILPPSSLPVSVNEYGTMQRLF